MNKIFSLRIQYFIVSFLAFVVIFGATESVFSQNAESEYSTPDSGLQISPTKFIWTLDEGTSKTERINVKNYSDFEQHVVVEVRDFFVGEDGAQPHFFVPDDDHPRKARDVIEWITPPEDFMLAPGEAKWVEFNVNVPTGQPTSGYYGSILFKSSGDRGDVDGSNIGINYRVGALIIMAVQGDEPMRMTADFQEFYPEQKIFWESPAKLIVKINNTGNIHFPMFGKITVNKFGKKFHVIELKPHIIYPDITKVYTEKMMFNWWDFGKYTADLSMWSEDEQIRFEEQTEFYIIPWKGLAVIVGGFVGLWILLWLFKKYVHIGKKPQKEKKKK